MSKRISLGTRGFVAISSRASMLSWLFVSTIGAVVTPSNATVIGPVEWRVEDGGNGHSYLAIIPASFISPQDARDDAVARGGDLATITSAAESSFVFNNLVNNPALWSNFVGPLLGGYQDRTSPDYNGTQSSGWHWVTGEPWSFTNWDADEPTNSGGNETLLGYIDKHDPYRPNDKWNDYNPVGALFPSYIVETPAPEPTGTGLLAVFAIVFLGKRQK